ncbi:unnamed protein product [Amoebophrya sp. A120]|nr:unnamed protein product [Amoebophrya sp. A120]|eukprot:GSA120T00018584001.1
MTKNANTLLQRLQREDFCYTEFPQSIGFHVFQLRILVVGSLIWLILLSLLGLLFCVSQFLADQRLSLIVLEMETSRIHKTVKQMLFMPSGVVGHQVDMGIRAEAMFEETDQIGLKQILEYAYDEFPTLQDVRLVFNQKSFGYYSSRQDGFQADTDRCADLGDFACLAINLKPADLSWYRKGMLLFDPSKTKSISYCDFLSPQFIPYSEKSGSPLLAQPPEPTFEWNFGFARVCKHEYAHLQGDSGRAFAVSKTLVNMETFLKELERRETFLGGRIYLVRYDLEMSTVAAMTNRIQGVQLSGGTLSPAGELSTVTDDFTDEMMTLILPGESFSSGTSHVLVREVRDSNGKYLLGMVGPFYQFSDSVMMPMLVVLLILFSLPFLAFAVVQAVKYYIRGYRSGIQFQTVEEVVRMNVALATSYKPANANDRAATRTLNRTGTAESVSPPVSRNAETRATHASSFGNIQGGF